MNIMYFAYAVLVFREQTYTSCSSIKETKHINFLFFAKIVSQNNVQYVYLLFDSIIIMLL